ncbi:MAG TPA: methyltransferase domain-containing protein [Jatrophihabitans sp.]|nr:methyltransferase domain-containing protein [Jatrophihabitans sp.]
MDQRNLLMHQAMLGDRSRLDAYDKALSQVVRPGAVVADLGAGTLALTALALRHGAGQVYAIEADPQLATVGERIIEASGWADRVTLIHGDARSVSLPGKVDVIVAELMGNLGPEEDMSRILHVFRRRHLRAGGVVVPERLVSYLAAAQFDDEGWGVWRDGFLDMRLDVIQQHAEPGAHLHFFTRPPGLLGPPAVLADSAAGNGAIGAGRPLRLPIDRPATLHAVLGYFRATLVPGVCLSNFPSYPGCNWAVWVWPVRHTAVGAGDELQLRLRIPDGGRIVTDWLLDCRLRRKGE